jgi:uncharacterized membrane protein
VAAGSQPWCAAIGVVEHGALVAVGLEFMLAADIVRTVISPS